MPRWNLCFCPDDNLYDSIFIEIHCNYNTKTNTFICKKQDAQDMQVTNLPFGYGEIFND